MPGPDLRDVDLVDVDDDLELPLVGDLHQERPLLRETGRAGGRHLPRLHLHRRDDPRERREDPVVGHAAGLGDRHRLVRGQLLVRLGLEEVERGPGLEEEVLRHAEVALGLLGQLRRDEPLLRELRLALPRPLLLVELDLQAAQVEPLLREGERRLGVGVDDREELPFPDEVPLGDENLADLSRHLRLDRDRLPRADDAGLLDQDRDRSGIDDDGLGPGRVGRGRRLPLAEEPGRGEGPEEEYRHARSNAKRLIGKRYSSPRRA